MWAVNGQKIYTFGLLFDYSREANFALPHPHPYPPRKCASLGMRIVLFLRSQNSGANFDIPPNSLKKFRWG